jgi:hypothetical protein
MLAVDVCSPSLKAEEQAVPISEWAFASLQVETRNWIAQSVICKERRSCEPIRGSPSLPMRKCRVLNFVSARKVEWAGPTLYLEQPCIHGLDGTQC